MYLSQWGWWVVGNYLASERTTQEKVLVRLLLGLFLGGCGQTDARRETQPVSPQTPVAVTQPAVASSSTPQKDLSSLTPNIKDQWRSLEPGLDFEEFKNPTPSEYGDSIISVLRIDPNKFALVLVSTSQAKEKRIHTAKEWSAQEGLLAAINASMYQADYLTSVHHLESKGHINNPNAFRERSVLVFDPSKKGQPAAQILDASCQDLSQSAALYQTQIEGIRMLSCKGENVWKPQKKKWSHAVISEDAQGNILFIHCRSPFVTHDFTIGEVIAVVIEVIGAVDLGLTGGVLRAATVGAVGEAIDVIDVVVDAVITDLSVRA
jgi:hypothetical protein